MLWGIHSLRGPGLQGFRAEPATPTQVLESLGGAESDRTGLPGEGVQDPEDFLGSNLGLGLRSTDHRVGLLLFADGTDCEWELFRTIPQEQLHLGIWPEMFK